jgi:hypothetical protein
MSATRIPANAICHLNYEILPHESKGFLVVASTRRAACLGIRDIEIDTTWHILDKMKTFFGNRDWLNSPQTQVYDSCDMMI